MKFLLTCSGLIFLSLLRIARSILSKCFKRLSSSLRRNSSEIVSKSRIGSTSPSTCVTSESSNAPAKKKTKKEK